MTYIRKNNLSEKYMEGSVTVFAALSLVIIISLISVMIETARIQGARVMVAQAARLSLNNMFAEFEAELLHDYGVLLFDGGEGTNGPDTDLLAARLNEDMKYNLDTDMELLFTKGCDFYQINIDSVSIDNCIAATDDCGLIWRTMIDDYAKIDYSIELMEELLQLNNSSEKNEAIQRAAEHMDECYETASGINADYLSLIENVDGVKCSRAGINFSQLKLKGSYVKRLCVENGYPDMEDLSIDDERVYNLVKTDVVDINALFDDVTLAFEKVISGQTEGLDKLVDMCGILRNILAGIMGNISRSKMLIERMRSDIVTLDICISAAQGVIETLEAVLDYDECEDFMAELQAIKHDRDKMKQRIECLDGMYEVLEKNYETVSAAYELCEDVRLWRSDTSDITANGPGYYSGYCEASQIIKAYRTDGMYLDYTGLECRQEDSSVLGCIYDYAMNGIFKLVMPEGSEISEKKITQNDLADMYGIRGDRGYYINDAVSDFMNELLFNMYIADTFPSYTDNVGTGSIDYVLEYIIFGKSGDKDNLSRAVSAVGGIRFGCNLTSIFTDSQKKAEAYEIAMMALGFTGIYALVKALQYTILTAWAIGETVVDLKILLNGGKVPALKKDEEWRLSLYNLVHGNLQVEKDNNRGLTYENYLTVVLLLADSQEKAFRSMTAVELDMINLGVPDFRLKNYIYAVDISVTYHLGASKKQYVEHGSFSY